MFGKLIQPGDKFSSFQSVPILLFVYRYLASGRSEEAYRICTALYQGSDSESVKDGALQCISLSSLMSGHFDRAETIIIRSVADSEHLTGKERSKYASKLLVLANLYQERGYFLIADKVLQKAEDALESDVIPLIPESTQDHQQASRLNQEEQPYMNKLEKEIQQLISAGVDDEEKNHQLQKINDEFQKVVTRFLSRNYDQSTLELHLSIVRKRWHIANISGDADKAFSLLRAIAILSAKYNGKFMNSSEALAGYYYLVNKGGPEEATKYLTLAKGTAKLDIGYSFDAPDPLPTTFNNPGAVALFGDASHSGVIASAIMSLGRVYRVEGNVIQARRFLNTALKGTQFTSGEDSNETANIIYELALTERQEGKLTVSLALLRKALAMVIANAEDAALLPSGNAIELMGNRNKIALEIIDLLYSSPQLLPESLRMQVLFEAFQCLHRQFTASSISSASLHLNQTNLEHRKLLDDYQTATRKLATTRSWYARLESNSLNVDTKQIEAINLLQQLQIQQGEVIRLRNKLNKAGVLSTTDTTSHNNFMEFQKKLLPGEVLLQFAFNNVHGYVLATTRQQQHIAIIKRGRMAFRKDVETLLYEVSHLPSDTMKFSLNIANTLYEQSLANVLSKFPQAKRLLLVADDVWDGFPFSVLVEGRHEQSIEINDYDKVDWLIRRYEIAYLPSPASLARLRTRSLSKAPDDILGIGSPVGLVPRSPTRGAFVASLLPQPDIQNLTGAVAVGELEQVEKFFAPAKRKILIGPDATNINFYKAKPENYKILLFATHGYLASDLSEIGEPALLMSTTSQESKPAFLTVNDIASMRIDANLVLLNACNTAGSDGMPGAESLTGMTNAFFFSGARSVIASLWSVNDHAATTMGVTVIGQSSRKKQASIASLLQQTMLMALKNGHGREKHPYYWAPYVIIGDPAIEPLSASKKTSFSSTVSMHRGK
ncbi:CHAT domain-containing protein [Buttiauxella sp. WJP83]|uniref:CHAT domain-containing protein n=1 Tax=Buttiauxella sp. WJP83 TaxID=2986951 RepID=UPI0022DD39CA|nr:CHAT domain-containing tetratricopeptide repeat protein [Buttiauxella sp. WJP83]WBM69341.1 CHAT domain-containing protein [Buttiauxella sp. WJP83]